MLLGKVKIYEIAKKLGLASKEVLEAAEKLNIEVKSHMSGVGEEEAKKIEERLSNRSEKPEKTVKPEKTTKTEKKIEYQDNTDRIEVERRFSLTKRCYGMGKIMTKLEETQLTSIALSVFVANIVRMQQRILSALFYGSSGVMVG